MTENTVENTEEKSRTRGLKPAWKPGQSGNPNGRPKGSKTGLRARLKRMLDRQPTDDILKVLEAKGIELEDKDYAEVIAYVVGREAVKGNMQATKIIAEQTELPHPRDLNLNADFHISIDGKDAGTL